MLMYSAMQCAFNTRFNAMKKNQTLYYSFKIVF